MAIKDITCIDIFNFWKSVDVCLKQDIDFPLDGDFQSWVWKKAPKFFQTQCKRIANEIFNNWYTFDNYRISHLHNLLFDKCATLALIKDVPVNETRRLYTQEQLKLDKEFIKMIMEQTKIKSVEQFFKFNATDTSICYDLIMKKCISPMFWIRYIDEWNKKDKEFIETDEHYRFRQVAKLLKREFTNQLNR